MDCCFDALYDYKNSCSAKHTLLEKSGHTADTLPLWVADMDFKSPVEIINALKETADFGVLGYCYVPDKYLDAVCKWQKDYFDWETSKEWIVPTPGVVNAISIAIRAFTQPGDGVLLQRPVYYPFTKMTEQNNRIVVNSPLVLKNNTYQIDFEDFEKQIVENAPKLFILCSPHNPVGRVWTKDELARMGDICVKHGVIVVSDEIHEDFAFTRPHIPFASIKPEFADISVTCTAPSKTFNIPALRASNIFIPNEKLRESFVAEKERCAININLMGIVACHAAYTCGADWLKQLKAYLQTNIWYVRDFVEKNLPQIKFIEPDGTFLVWLDFRALGLSHDELIDLIEKKARLWLDDGAMFGEEGEGFQRVNIASPLCVIEEAMQRLKTAVDAL